MMPQLMKLTTLALVICIATCRAQNRCTVTLQLGSRGDCVRKVQQVVGTTVDGIFGQNTKNAVINFQRRSGLVADGIVGRNTWAAIYGTSGSPPQSGNGGSSRSQNCGCSYDNTGSQCSGGPTQGARKLAAYLKERYGSRQEIYNCRPVRGGTGLSLHAEGRAVDHYASGQAGREVFDHLVSIACQNGIQEVIYNRRIWTNGPGERNYSGSNPHIDHVHVGLNRCGAQNFNL